jgi:hypothetical protein
MSNEIKYTLSITIENGEFKEKLSDGQISVDQAAIGKGGSVQIIGTSEEVISTGDVSTLGWCRLKNLDPANYVTYGPEDTGAMVNFGRIEAGEQHWFRLEPLVVMRAQANTAPVKLDVRVYED